MSTTSGIPLGASVVVSAGIGFGGGVSPWQGRKGTVTKLLKTSRAVLVDLHDGKGALMFFVRELSIDTDPTE